MKKKSPSPQTLWTITTLLGTLLYAIVRYITFGEYGTNDIPLYLLNKSVSWSSVILLLLAVSQKSEYRRYYFRIAKLLLVIHTAISLILISPEVYPKFYNDGSFTLLGGMAMISGILCFTAIFFRIIVPHETRESSTSIPSKPQLTVIVFALLLIHTACIGAPGWLTPEKWNGAMPPITLLAFLAGLIALILTVLKRNTTRQ